MYFSSLITILMINSCQKRKHSKLLLWLVLIAVVFCCALANNHLSVIVTNDITVLTVAPKSPVQTSTLDYWAVAKFNPVPKSNYNQVIQTMWQIFSDTKTA